MAQFGSPISDISQGSWTDEGLVDNDGNLYTSLDEITSDNDSSYIHTSTNNDTCEVRLTSLTDPGVDTGHVLHVYFKTSGGGAPERLHVYLYQGTTLIETWENNTNRDAAYIDINQTLANASSITDYTNLRVRLVSNNIGGGESVDVTNVRLDLPDANIICYPNDIGHLVTFDNVTTTRTRVVTPNAMDFGATFDNVTTTRKRTVTPDAMDFAPAFDNVNVTIQSSAIQTNPNPMDFGTTFDNVAATVYALPRAADFAQTAGDQLRHTTGAIDYQNPYTVMAHVYIDASTFNYGYIFSVTDESVNNEDMCGNNGTTLALRINSRKDGVSDNQVGTTLSAGWHHIAMVRESLTSLKLYVDGTLYKESTVSMTGRAASTRVQFGAHYDANFSFHGKMFAIKEWTTALNSTEIQTEIDYIAPVKQSSLNAWYPIKDDSILDFGSGGYDLTNPGAGVTFAYGKGVTWMLADPASMDFAPTFDNVNVSIKHTVTPNAVDFAPTFDNVGVTVRKQVAPNAMDFDPLFRLANAFVRGKMRTKIGTFQISSGFGSSQTQQVNGVGFQPDYVFFFWGGEATQDNSSVGPANYGFSYSDRWGSERFVSSYLADNQGTVSAHNYSGYSSGIQYWNNVASSMPGSRATLSSVHSDGFTIQSNGSEAWSANQQVTYIAIKAQLGTYVYRNILPTSLGEFDQWAGQGNGLSSSLLTMSIHRPTEEAAGTSGRPSIGWVGNSPSEQWGIGATTNGVPVNAMSYSQSGELIVDGQAAQRKKFASYKNLSWDAGYRLDNIEGTTANYYQFVSFDNMLSKVGTFNTPADTNNFSVTGIGFRPEAVLFFSLGTAPHTVDVSRNTESTKISIGAGNHQGQSVQASFSAKDANPSAAARSQDNSAVYQRLNSSTVEEQMSLVSIDSDGFTAKMDVATSGGNAIFWVAIQGGKDRVVSCAPDSMDFAPTFDNVDVTVTPAGPPIQTNPDPMDFGVTFDNVSVTVRKQVQPDSMDFAFYEHGPNEVMPSFTWLRDQPLVNDQKIPYIHSMSDRTHAGAAGITVPLPDHQANDILVLAVEVLQNAPATPSGWTAFPGTPLVKDTYSSNSAWEQTILLLFWKRATSSSETDPSFTDSGYSHIIASALSIRGVRQQGNPFEGSYGTTQIDNPHSTNHVFNGVTTDHDNSLALLFFTWGMDVAWLEFTNLTSSQGHPVSDIWQQGTAQSDGGGLVIAQIEMPTPGATGTITASQIYDYDGHVGYITAFVSDNPVSAEPASSGFGVTFDNVDVTVRKQVAPNAVDFAPVFDNVDVTVIGAILAEPNAMDFGTTFDNVETTRTRSVSPDPLDISTTFENTTATITKTVAPDPSSFAVTFDEVAVVLTKTTSPDDANISVTFGNVSVTNVKQAIPDDSAFATTFDNVTVNLTVNATPADSAITLTFDNVTVNVTGTILAEPNQVDFAVSFDSPVITLTKQVAPADSDLSLTFDEPVVSRTRNAQPDDANLTPVFDEPVVTLTLIAVPSGAGLDVTFDEPVVTKTVATQPDSLTSSVAFEEPQVTKTIASSPANSDFAVAFEEPQVSVRKQVVVDDAAFSVSFDQVETTKTLVVLTQDPLFTVSFENVSIDLTVGASPNDATSVTLFDNVTVVVTGSIDAQPDEIFFSTTFEEPTVTRNRTTAPDDVGFATVIDNATVSVTNLTYPDAVDFSVEFESPGVQILRTATPDDADLSVNLESPAVTKTVTVTPEDAGFAFVVDNLDVVYHVVVSPDDVAFQSEIEQAVINMVIGAQPNDMLSLSLFENVNIVTTGVIAAEPDDMLLTVTFRRTAPTEVYIEASIVRPSIYVENSSTQSIFPVYENPSIIMEA